jgi:hypothetical protein
MANHQSTVVLLPPEFIAMCEADGVSPDQVLNGFLADLCGQTAVTVAMSATLRSDTMIAVTRIGQTRRPSPRKRGPGTGRGRGVGDGALPG